MVLYVLWWDLTAYDDRCGGSVWFLGYVIIYISHKHFYTSRHEQNGLHCAENTFKCTFFIIVVIIIVIIIIVIIIIIIVIVIIVIIIIIIIITIDLIEMCS